MNEDKAVLFDEMAKRVRAAPEGEFAGAVLIVPPGDGEPMEFMSVEPRPNPAHFWNGAKARLDIAHAEVLERERTGDPFRRR